MTHELPNNYIAVPTPEGATDFEIMMGRLTFLNTGIGLSGITLPSSGQWQLIGLASELGSDVANVENFTATLESLSLNPSTTIILKRV